MRFVLAPRPIDDFVCFRQRRNDASSLQTARGPLPPDPTCYRPHQGGYAVPGWTDEQTRYWLDNAAVAAGLG
jgi:hypothetical protein